MMILAKGGDMGERGFLPKKEPGEAPAALPGVGRPLEGGFCCDSPPFLLLLPKGGFCVEVAVLEDVTGGGGGTACTALR